MEEKTRLDALKIVTDPHVLSEDFLPLKLPWREDHGSQIYNALLPLAKGEKPFHTWLHGPPGSGKTETARRAVEDFCSKHTVTQVRVDCWKCRTFYSVIEEILNET